MFHLLAAVLLFVTVAGAGTLIYLVCRFLYDADSKPAKR